MRPLRLAAALLAAALLAPAAAHARFGEPQRFPRERSYGPQEFALAGNERGDRVVVWRVPQGFAFAQAAPGGAFRDPTVLPRSEYDSQTNMEVELDARGNAVFVWSYDDRTETADVNARDGGCCFGLRARIIRRSGAFTAPKTLVPPGTDTQLADLHVNAAGRFGIVFRAARNGFAPVTMQARFGTIARGFGGRERLPVAARRFESLPDRLTVSFVRGRPRLLYPQSTEKRNSAFNPQLTALRELERVRAGAWRGLASAARMELIPSTVRLATAPNGRQAAVWYTAY
ncbi:MAG: hypothetical protein M3340_10930, partial [Actinomycetota bacterium]|nr:hypothetical protein [Actinomycetota bacterium]